MKAHPPGFRPIPAAICDRVCRHAKELRNATTPAEQIKALFLAHCELKEAETMIVKPKENEGALSQ